jgi:crossover junction endodeoxyribonuclease RuvC
MIICGIDPGITGAIAYLWDTGELVVEDMPTLGGDIDAHALKCALAEMRPEMVFIERQNARPGMGVASMFNMGVSYGFVRGAIMAAAIPLEFVTPAVWKKHFKLGKDKDESRAKAAQYWPGHEGFRRKKDHNRAEAALIARYGAAMLNQKVAA